MYYFIYCKGPNEKRFTLCNPWKGTRGMGKVYAPRFLKDQADYAVAWMAEHNPPPGTLNITTTKRSNEP